MRDPSTYMPGTKGGDASTKHRCARLVPSALRSPPNSEELGNLLLQEKDVRKSISKSNPGRFSLSLIRIPQYLGFVKKEIKQIANIISNMASNLRFRTSTYDCKNITD